jgi:hypothetical protein
MALEPDEFRLDYFGRFRFDLTCSKCGASHAIDGPLETVVCPRCGGARAVAEHVGDVVGDFERNEGDRRSGGLKTTLGSLASQSRYRMVEPACLRCGAAFPAVALRRAGRFRCAACTMPHETTAAPAWLRRAAPEARACIVPVRGDDGAARTELSGSASEGKVELLACPGCRADLRVTAATGRDVACEHCGLAIRVSDELWNRLHPWTDPEWVIGFAGIKDVVAKARVEWSRRLAGQRAEAAAGARRGVRTRAIWTAGGSAFFLWLTANAMVPWTVGLLVGLGAGLAIGLATYVVGRLRIPSDGGPTREDSEHDLTRLAEHLLLERSGRRLTGVIDGRPLRIDLDADYQVELGLSAAPWFLSTREETPDLPGFEPFSGGSAGFDGFFVTRLARAEIARAMPAGGAHAALENFRRFGTGDRVADVLIAPTRIALSPILGHGAHLRPAERTLDFHATLDLVLAARKLAPELERDGDAGGEPALVSAAPAKTPPASAAPGTHRPLPWGREQRLKAMQVFARDATGAGAAAGGVPAFARLEFEIRCDRCEHLLPVNGPFDALGCPRCGRPYDPSALIVVLAELFARGVDRGPGRTVVSMSALPLLKKRAGPDGRTGPVTAVNGVGRFVSSYRQADPACLACGGSLAALAGAPAGDAACPGCGAFHRLLDAPDWLRGEVPAASACLTLDRDLPPPPDRLAVEPLRCPGCGGDVPLAAGRPRSGECPFCRAQLVVPDDVWRRLHPAGTHPWFVRFDPPDPSVD